MLYREIRDAFIFLKRVTPLGAVEDEQQLTEESVRRMKAEAEVLDCLFLFFPCLNFMEWCRY